MRDPQHRRSIFLGIAAASATPVLGLLIHSGYWPKSFSDLRVVALFYALFYVLTLPGVLILGLPIVLLLKRNGWLSWLKVLASSIVAGNLYRSSVSFSRMASIRGSCWRVRSSD